MKRNIGYKLLALGIALIIWWYASERQNPTIKKDLGLPLGAHKVEAGYAVTSKPHAVKVRLEGPRTHVNSIVAEPDAVTAYVNLRGKASGRHTLPVIVRLPSGYAGLVNMVSIPEKVTVTLEKKAQRTLGVNAQFAGSPPVGYRFGTPRLSPSRATISGIARQVNKVSRLVVAVDPAESGAQNIDGDFPIMAVDKDDTEVQDLELTPTKVRLQLDLVEAPANRVVFVSVDTVGQPPFPYKVAAIYVEPDSVMVTGRPERLTNVSTIKTEPLNLADRTSTFSQRVRLVAPRGLTPADGSYVRVTVKIAAPADAENKPAEPSGGNATD